MKSKNYISPVITVAAYCTSAICAISELGGSQAGGGGGKTEAPARRLYV